jgi:hypothetical protein
MIFDRFPRFLPRLLVEREAMTSVNESRRAFCRSIWSDCGDVGPRSDGLRAFASARDPFDSEGVDCLLEGATGSGFFSLGCRFRAFDLSAMGSIGVVTFTSGSETSGSLYEKVRGWDEAAHSWNSNGMS